MSNPTTSPAPVNPIPQPADVSAAADKAALDKAAEALARRQQADMMLQCCVSSFQQGELGMKTGRLDTGRYADAYIAQRLAIGDSRDASVKTLEGELSKWASTPVNVNTLIRTYHAYRLLAVETNTVETVLPYGHYEQAFCQLVERQDKDTPRERWVLIQGFEQRAVALFRDAVANGLSQLKCRENVQAVMREYAIAQQAVKAAEEEQAKAKAAEAKAAADKAKAEQKAAELLEKAAKDAMLRAKEEEKAQLTAAMEEARQKKLAAQKAATELAAARQQAEREAKLAEQRRNAAEKAAEKAANPPERKPTDRTPDRKPQESKPPVHNPLVAAKTATAKDLAESLVAQLNANAKPHDVLREFARLMRWCGADVRPFVDGMLASGAEEIALDMAEYISTALTGNTLDGSKAQLAKAS